MLKRWVDCKNVQTCLRCGIAFSFLVRKHHCRMCGRVFCGDCAGHHMPVPALYVEGMPLSPPTAAGSFSWGAPSHTKRLCVQCADRAVSTQHAHVSIQVLLILTERGELTMADWGRLRRVSLVFQDAVMHLMRILRKARSSTLPNRATTTIERRLVDMHRHALNRHPDWLLTVGRVEEDDDDGRPTPPCAWLGCRCGPVMRISNALEIVLNHAHRPRLYETAVQALRAAGPHLVPFRPMVCYATLRTPPFLHDFVLPAAAESPDESHRYAWTARGIGHDRLYEHVRRASQVPDELDASVRFADCLLALAREVTLEGRARILAAWRANARGHVFLPGQRDWSVQEVRSAEIRRLSSSTQPTVVPCVCRHHGDQGRLALITLLVKQEGVLKDVCVMNCLAEIDRLTQHTLPIVTYHVQPLSIASGLIVVVSQAVTLYKVASSQMTIQNYLNEKNPRVPCEEIRKRFLQSCAVSCVLSHVCGVGDRHLDNIMLSDAGCLFHIDYGYIFREEPFHRRGTNTIKLTSDVVDMLGGTKSGYFVQFQQEVVRIFNLLRSDVKGFYYVFAILAVCKCLSREQLVTHIEDSLVPLQTKKEAEISIVDSIRRNTFHTRWDNMLDTVHFLKKTWFA